MGSEHNVAQPYTGIPWSFLIITGLHLKGLGLQGGYLGTQRQCQQGREEEVSALEPLHAPGPSRSTPSSWVQRELFALQPLWVGLISLKFSSPEIIVLGSLS